MHAYTSVLNMSADSWKAWHAPRRREIRTGSEDRSLYTRTHEKKRVPKSRAAGRGVPDFAVPAHVSSCLGANRLRKTFCEFLRSSDSTREGVFTSGWPVP